MCIEWMELWLNACVLAVEMVVSIIKMISEATFILVAGHVNCTLVKEEAKSEVIIAPLKI